MAERFLAAAGMGGVEAVLVVAVTLFRRVVIILFRRESGRNCRIVCDLLPPEGEKGVWGRDYGQGGIEVVRGRVFVVGVARATSSTAAQGPLAARGPCPRPLLPYKNSRNLTDLQSFQRQNNLTKNPGFRPK